MYLENLWSLMDEIQRVLKVSGTVWINLGDTYSTQSGTNTQISKKGYKTNKSPLINRGESGNISKGNLKPKSLLLIPHRFAIGCFERGWIIRNDIVWAKRNGMPESVKDRFSKKHEYVFFMTKSTNYYFDLNAVLEIQKQSSILRQQRATNTFDGKKKGGLNNKTNDPTRVVRSGKNPGDVSDFWDIITKPSSKGHYATYNTDLIDKPIIAGCPEDGIILDPFCGTATTGVRALQLKRNFIGIEGSKEYVKIGQMELYKEKSQTKMF